VSLLIEQFICRGDNYAVLLHDTGSGETAAIDAPDGAAITARLKQKGWGLDHILVTHHHGDHTEGIPGLKSAYGAKVTAPEAEADRIRQVDKTVRGGDKFIWSGHAVEVLDTPGHTLGHVSYVIPSQRLAFVADTLFAVGCGRVMEGTMEMMWGSLEKLAALPGETAVYCGHEYTEANIRFALTIEPDNADLVNRGREVATLRAAGKMTLPTTIALEKRTNPFLRADQPGIRARLGMEHAPAASVFGEIRQRKDRFK
jgi:hydroxyacylglutathione hydrolase